MEQGNAVTHLGMSWRVVSVGAYRAADRKVYCHLASTTNFTKQRNGMIPKQICDWIDVLAAVPGFVHAFKRKGQWFAEITRTPDISEGVLESHGPFASVKEVRSFATERGLKIHNA